MLDFRAMFPGVSPERIEAVLRKYDGDVSATINELLFDNVRLHFFGTGQKHKYLPSFNG